MGQNPSRGTKITDEEQAEPVSQEQSFVNLGASHPNLRESMNDSTSIHEENAELRTSPIPPESTISGSLSNSFVIVRDTTMQNPTTPTTSPSAGDRVRMPDYPEQSSTGGSPPPSTHRRNTSTLLDRGIFDTKPGSFTGYAEETSPMRNSQDSSSPHGSPETPMGKTPATGVQNQQASEDAPEAAQHRSDGNTASPSSPSALLAAPLEEMLQRMDPDSHTSNSDCSPNILNPDPKIPPVEESNETPNSTTQEAQAAVQRMLSRELTRDHNGTSSAATVINTSTLAERETHNPEEDSGELNPTNNYFQGRGFQPPTSAVDLIDPPRRLRRRSNAPPRDASVFNMPNSFEDSLLDNADVEALPVGGTDGRRPVARAYRRGGWVNRLVNINFDDIQAEVGAAMVVIGVTCATGAIIVVFWGIQQL
ncbi:hypothetical protein P154DRAFT_573815 [Amniculicola lignicola CBS 123094]|uniref:Uncharacterized protein n=1 Tax=Amniculicola lignicola CBS 123094 TaxID=1392246 RepID=A0A6A5WP05_9PLEO|nr:hypothetical protein P154DRAFT_573815 [Amniculicola lignicola CBS 123094]